MINKKITKDIFDFKFNFDNSNSEYYDDCPICQAQKKADEEGRNLTIEEYMEASLKAAKLPDVITGDFSTLR